MNVNGKTANEQPVPCISSSQLRGNDSLRPLACGLQPS